MRLLTFPLLCCAGLVLARTAYGQNVTVQQPAFSVFQVNTTVSVPDSGGAFVGGSGRVASGTTTQGLAPAGSVVGREARGSSLQARVAIHDLAALDEQILAAAPELEGSGSRRQSARLSPLQELAWRRMQQEAPSTSQSPREPIPAPWPLAGDRSPTRRSTGPALADAQTPADPKRLAEASRMYREGLAAQSAGRQKLALAYLRTAAQQGSLAAREELGRLRATEPADRANATNPTKDDLSPGSDRVERAVAQPLGFEAKSKSKRSGSARN